METTTNFRCPSWISFKTAWKRYISRHYKLALSHIFDILNFGSVIITDCEGELLVLVIQSFQDDLSIAEDFFEYFSATRHLLEVDPSLYCVSAWNDNGKKDLIDISEKGARLLHRSDFFSGLGWMMTKCVLLRISLTLFSNGFGPNSARYGPMAFGMIGYAILDNGKTAPVFGLKFLEPQ